MAAPSRAATQTERTDGTRERARLCRHGTHSRPAEACGARHTTQARAKSRARSKSTRTVARRASPAGRPATKRSSAAAAHAPAVLKDALLGQLVTILGCAGYDLDDCVKTFAAHAERQAKSARASSPGADHGLVDSAHVLTWWYTTPEYLDEFGSPRPLPFAGKCSFSALLNRALPEFDAEEVLAFLVRTGSVVREGSRFRPTRRDVVLDKQNDPLVFLGKT